MNLICRNRKNFLYNSTLLRYGINKNSEIRFQTDYAQFKAGNYKISGFNPLTVGTKLLISEKKGILPQTSFLFNLTLPYFGNKNLRPTNPAPLIYLLLQNDFTQKINVCYNLGLEYDGESSIPNEFTAICFGYNSTDRLSWFIENYNYFSDKIKPEYFIDFGIAYLFGKNIQIDLSGNNNLQNFEKYFMVGFGFSWRIPK